MSRLQESLESGKFTVTGEVGPPKGVDLGHCLEGAELMKDKVSAVNVTDIQTAVMRLSSVATCVKLLELGVEPILQALFDPFQFFSTFVLFCIHLVAPAHLFFLDGQQLLFCLGFSLSHDPAGLIHRQIIICCKVLI